MNHLTQAIDRFDAYFRSANGVPPNDRISVPTAEWVALRSLLVEALSEYLAATQQGLAAALTEVVGCFRAAEVEGLQEVLQETTDDRLKDLVERRLMYALYAADAAIAAQTKQGGV